MRGKKGFTLLELMIVVIIIAVLAAMVTPRFFGSKQKAMRSRAMSDVKVIESAIQRFKLDMDRYPESLDELIAAPADDEEEKWGGPYLENSTFLDPWQQPYYFEAPGTHNTEGFDLASFGADGSEGGEGENEDICNW